MTGRLMSRRDFARVRAVRRQPGRCRGQTPATAWPAAHHRPVRAPLTHGPSGEGKYKEAPQLAARCRRHLPPVEERIPVDPMVITPWESIGQYGAPELGSPGAIGARVNRDGRPALRGTDLNSII